jgi:hypothetical protein
VDLCIKQKSHILPPRVTHFHPKKAWEALGTSQKMLYEGGGFDLKSFGGELVQGKKMLFQLFI